MVELFFSDPVLETAVTSEPAPIIKKTGLICSHCHREIRGKVFTLGNLHFDQYCWSLRYILEAQRQESDRAAELKRKFEIQEYEEKG